MADISQLNEGFFTVSSEVYQSNLSASISAENPVVPVNSANDYDDGDWVALTVDAGTTDEATFIGKKNGNEFEDCIWTEGNLGVGHSAGATIVDYDSASHHSAMTKGLLKVLNQDGTLKPDPIRTALGLSNANLNGWDVVSEVVSSVTANGNRSYDLLFSSPVNTVLSEGMRLRTQRATPAPQTAFSLDGVNDYYNNTSVAGMTFTDDFCVSAWVYLTAYQTGAIASRYNGTSGWDLLVNSSGQIVMRGFNSGSGNSSSLTSYQSIPLNKWVHVAAQLDMSAFSVSGTTNSYVMIDGVAVPATVSRTGTNPTALVQAGNLEIGTTNGGGNNFPGYIDQVAIYSAKVTQATHLAAMHQGLTGSETSLISAYSNGSTTDLNTTNANNLTAQNGATTASVSPFGNNARSSTLDYALVTKVAGAVVTVQVPEGCTIPTSGGVSAVAYSTQANPYGFVSDKGRWVVETHSFDNSSTLTASAWGNSGSIRVSMPVGAWDIGGKLLVKSQRNTGTVSGCEAALSENTSSVSAGYETSGDWHQDAPVSAGSNYGFVTALYPKTSKTYSAQTTVYLINYGLYSTGTLASTGTSSANHGHHIIAECAYL